MHLSLPHTCYVISDVTTKVVYFPSHMSPAYVHRFVTTVIEAVSATIQLPNADNLQIAVVYLSLSVTQATLTTLLTTLLTHVTVCSVILGGNFNKGCPTLPKLSYSEPNVQFQTDRAISNNTTSYMD